MGVAMGSLKAHAPPKCLELIVILCFERRYPKQNSIIRLKSNILAPKFLGWLRYWHCARWILPNKYEILPNSPPIYK